MIVLCLLSIYQHIVEIFCYLNVELRGFDSSSTNIGHISIQAVKLCATTAKILNTLTTLVWYNLKSHCEYSYHLVIAFSGYCLDYDRKGEFTCYGVKFSKFFNFLMFHLKSLCL